jgi:hypothetical protein
MNAEVSLKALINGHYINIKRKGRTFEFIQNRGLVNLN